MQQVTSTSEMAVDMITQEANEPPLPLPIFRVAHHYYLYHAPTIAYLRAKHHILGSLIGTLPQANQQNVFAGLPLSLLPEEVRLMCEKGVAFVVDGVAYHEAGLEALRSSEDGRSSREAFELRLRQIGEGIRQSVQDDKARERDAALSKISDKELQKRAQRAEEKKARRAAQLDSTPGASEVGEDDVGTDQDSRSADPQASLETYSLTPASSIPPLERPTPSTPPSLPLVPSSYPMYRHLHDQGYFMHPGLRFGCQYMAYPGDPLRFHSHFLVVSREWDQEVKLSTIIGCGRLGTGVKKGFLLGGVEKKGPADAQEDADDTNARCFSIEWGGM